MNEPSRDEEAIFLAALEKSTSQERDAYAAKACAGDQQLFERVKELLASHDDSAGPLDSPPSGVNATIAQPIAEKAGASIGPYKLLQQIGEGGFGVVYMAEQIEPVRRKVALKIIKPGMDTRDVIARFEAERQALALMDHPNIAKVFDGGTTDSGRPYFVMELVKGVPLTDFCDTNKLDMSKRLQLFATVCRAVQHAHQKGVIHRDLKPSNVMVTLHDGRPVPKVIDFGVSKAISQRLTEKTLFTAYGQMIGTPAYMSPEQAEMSGLDIDTRSDVYSLGVLLYELLTGGTPLQADKLRGAAYMELQRIIREEEPPKPSTRLSTLGDATASVALCRATEPKKLGALVRGDLDWIVMRALEKDRERRYDSANGLANDVERFLNREAVEACPPSIGYKFRSYVRRNKHALVVAGAINGLLLIGVVVSVVLTVQMHRERNRANSAETLARSRLAEVQQEQQRANDALAAATRERNRAVQAEQQEVARRREAQQQKDAADRQRLHAEQQARIANARRLAARSRETLREFPQRSLLLAVEAIQTSWRAHERHVPVAEQTLRDALAFIGGIPVTGTFAWKTDRWLATHENQTIRLFDLEHGPPAEAVDMVGDPTGKTIRLDHQKRLTTSANGEWLVSEASEPSTGSLHVWNLSLDHPTVETVVAGQRGEIQFAAITSDKRWLVTGSKQTTRVWNLRSDKEQANSPRVLDGYAPRALGPNGRWLVTTREDRTAQLWSLSEDEVSTDPTILDPRGEMDEIVSAMISPDGRWLVLGGSKQRDSRVWDLTAANDLAVVKFVLRTEFHVRRGAELFSPDSRWLVSPGNNLIHAWDMQADDPVATEKILRPRGDLVKQPVAFSDFENVLVAGSHLWNLSGEEPDGEPVIVDGPHTCVAFSSDRRWLAYGGADKAIRLWNLMWISEAADKRIVSPIVLRGHEQPIESVGFSRDNRWLISTSTTGNTRLWDMNTSIKSSSPRVLGGQQARGLSPDGRWLVTHSQMDDFADNGKAIRLWDLAAKNPSEVSSVLGGHSQGLFTLAFSSNNRWLVTIGWDLTARLWDLRSADPSQASIPLLTGKEAVRTPGVAPMLHCSFSASGRWLMISGPDLQSRVWDMDQEVSTQPFLVIPAENQSLPVRMRVSSDDRWMATVGSRESATRPGTTTHMQLWDLTAQQPTALRLDGHLGGVGYAEFTGDSRWLISAGATMKTVQVWDLHRENPADEPMLLRGHQDDIKQWRLSPDRQWLATRSSDKTIRLWRFPVDAPPNSAIVLTAEDDHEFLSVEFSPDSRWLSAGRSDAKAVSLWDLASSNLTGSRQLLQSGSPIMSESSFSPDGHWLLNWSPGENRMRLTDLTLQLAAEPAWVELRGHPDEAGVSAAVFSSDSRWLATFCEGLETRLWDLTAPRPDVTPMVLTGLLTESASGADSRHNDGVPNAPFSGDGRWLVTRYQTPNGQPNTALWELRLQELMKLAQRTAGRSLSPEERHLYVAPE